MQPVEKGQLWVMRIHALMVSLMMLAGGAIAEHILREELGVPVGTVLGPLAVVAVYAVLFSPARRHRALGYRMDPEELHAARGVWTRTETVVPLARVQHIDVSQGPVERMFAVSRLVLHTAGTMNSLVVVPGLRRETAEAMRDEIRSRIRHSES
jgi:membrane protein YdbS with pleckstrin-like domain